MKELKVTTTALMDREKGGGRRGQGGGGERGVGEDRWPPHPQRERERERPAQRDRENQEVLPYLYRPC